MCDEVTVEVYQRGNLLNILSLLCGHFSIGAEVVYVFVTWGGGGQTCSFRFHICIIVGISGCKHGLSTSEEVWRQQEDQNFTHPHQLFKPQYLRKVEHSGEPDSGVG